MKIAVAQNHLSVQSRCMFCQNTEQQTRGLKKLFAIRRALENANSEIKHNDARLSGNANLSQRFFRLGLTNLCLAIWFSFFEFCANHSVASLKSPIQVFHSLSHRQWSHVKSAPVSLPNRRSMMPVDFLRFIYLHFMHGPKIRNKNWNWGWFLLMTGVVNSLLTMNCLRFFHYSASLKFSAESGLKIKNFYLTIILKQSSCDFIPQAAPKFITLSQRNLIPT